MSLSFPKHQVCLTFQLAKFIKLPQIDHILGHLNNFPVPGILFIFIPVWLLEQKGKYVA